MKNLLLFGFLLTLLFTSCKKEEPAQPEKIQYLPMSVGSYWVYENYKIDFDGVETALKLDSFFINRDTMINGFKYAILEGEGTHIGGGIQRIFRDSSDYIVDHKGNKIFSSKDFTNVLDSFIDIHNGKIVLKVSSIMIKKQVPITVPAGTFSTFNKKGTTYLKNNTPTVPEARNYNIYYANNVGMILETYYFLSSPYYYERRLIRYHIN